MVTLNQLLKQFSLIFFFIPFFLFSTEFTATVSQTQVHFGNSLTLTLSLKGSSSKANPDIDSLKKSFVIHSQQQSLHTSVFNGQATSSTNWRLVLIPKIEGDVEIPSISVDTSTGTLSTQSIMIQVTKEAAKGSSHAQDGLALTSSVSEENLYKNGTFVYTIQLSSTQNLANLKMENLEVKDAIVESDEKPKIYEQIVNGVQKVFIEYRYYITPIKEGSLTIPPTIIQGGVIVQRKSGRSFFDDDLDLFSMQGFGRIQPFVLTTEEKTISILPPIAGMDPWLPAKSLKIEEVWNEHQTLQAGEPFNRGFKIKAEGIHSSQLPSLNDLQSSKSLKIYADKPEISNDFQDSTIHSYRNEQYTIIPQQAGSVILPTIEVEWWNTVENKKMIASIPARKLDILPSSVQITSQTQSPASDQVANLRPISDPMNVQSSFLNYALIGGLILLLILSICWGIFLQRKISRLKADHLPMNREGSSFKQTKPSIDKAYMQRKEKKEKLIDLNPT